LGENNCAQYYSGDRCAQCIQGVSYRINGKCEKCPDSPAALAIILILILICAMGIGYLLNRKNISLALISVGVDYAQVVAIFSQSNIAWPDSVEAIFKFLSAFNLNLDVIAPECALPGLTFSTKWGFIEILPLAMFGV
jgi:hypothetical protein